MSIELCVTPPSLVADLTPAPRTGLRLVSNNSRSANLPDGVIYAPAVPFLSLKSAIEEKNSVMLSVLASLFKRLEPGERIEFVHRISLRTGPLSKKPYSLTIKVACPDSKLAQLKQHVAEVLFTAYPGLHFEPAHQPLESVWPNELSSVAQFALAGVVVTAKPAVTRFDQGERAPSTDLSRYGNDAAGAKRLVWPFPGKLANWGLTAPLYEPLDLPDTVEIAIRVHGFSLSPAACADLHTTMRRVLAGNLDVFHPDSPLAAYSASDDLKDAAVELVRHWLQRPTGYAIDCVVFSSSPLGDVAQQRVVGDVFGDRPFERVRCFDRSSPQRLAQPTFAWANLVEQGIPALMPGQWQLHSLNIPRHYPVPAVLPPQNGAWIGTTVCGRHSSRVALPPECRSRHVAIFGATGSGKSSLMTQMIREDIADPNRSCGIGLIDPHGDLYERVLSMIPPSRANDVVLIDTSDLSTTACLNPLEGMKDDPLLAQFVVSEVMSLIDMLFESKDTSGPLLRANLRNLLLLAGYAPDRGTFLDACRILEDSEYCDYVLTKCRDRNVKDYWEKFRVTKGSDNGYPTWLPYIMARLTPFVSNPIMKRLINRPASTIDLAAAMRERKIVLFNLSKGVLQDVECQVLGSLILMKFFAAAIGRGRLPPEDRAPFHLYVDEFQTFSTDSVPRLFSEARKFGLCLTTSNQSISQLNNRWGRSNIGDSVLANTATKFLFRLGPADAELLKPYYQPHFDDAAMANLPDFHAVAAMSDNNRPLPPFAFRANLAQPDTALHAPAAELVAQSVARYSVPIVDANKELVKLYALTEESLGVPAPAPEIKKPGVFAKLFDEAKSA